MVVIPTATALPTAEGAVQVAMEELPLTLHSARVLIPVSYTHLTLPTIA